MDKGAGGGAIPIEGLEPRRMLSANLVRNINTLTVGAAPGDLADVDGVVYFAADPGGGTAGVGREFWRSDGTAAGSGRVLDLAPGAAASVIEDSYFPPPHVVSGSLLFFTANDGQGGVELYQSDGTPGGTVRIQELYPGATASDPKDLVGAGGTLFFAATDPVYGRELWTYRDMTPPRSR